MLDEHERIVLTSPLAQEGLEIGDVGTIVHVYQDGKAYEVEFVALDGHTTAVATVEATQVRPVTRRDMTHTREIQAVKWRIDGARPLWFGPFSAMRERSPCKTISLPCSRTIAGRTARSWTPAAS